MRYFRLPLSLVILGLAALVFPKCDSSTLESLYKTGRQIRALKGHDAARPLYEEILSRNRKDHTAAARIARHPDSIYRHSKLGAAGTLAQQLDFTARLQKFNYTPSAIADLVFPQNPEKAKSSSAPLYLQPLRAGAPAPPLPTCSLSTCIQLFLLAVCLPVEVCQKYLGKELVGILQTLGVAYKDNDGWLVPYCHVMPIASVNKTLYLATDLHPNVLSTTMIGGNEGAVMYIGPDSLALLDHWNSKQYLSSGSHIVDIGTGSGVQALSMASNCNLGEVDVTCVDINPRALRLARLNFRWNGMKEPRLVIGDIQAPVANLYSEDKRTLSWQEALEHPDMILANPPFLPVPIQDAEISKRYGWFSSGGASGDAVLHRIIALASETLSTSSGKLAIVSEFMNPKSEFPQRLQEWWGNAGSAKAFLFTNEHAMGAETYAERRADSTAEIERWKKHLESEKITHISPGLLFLKMTSVKGDRTLEFSHFLVPKTSQGSIWTPTNRDAREYTQNIMNYHW